MDAGTWGIISYILAALAVIFLLLMVVISLKVIRFIMLIGLLLFGVSAYMAHEKKIEEEKIFSTTKFEKGAGKIMDGFKDIGKELSKDIGKSVDENISKESQEKIADKVNKSMDVLNKWAEKAADKSIEVITEGKEKSKEIIEDAKK